MSYICRFQEPTVTYEEMNMIFHIRNLWRELATWTRVYLITRTSYPEIADGIYNRMNKIVQEFGNTFSLVFGEQIAQEYMRLLTDQVTLTKELIDAEAAGNSKLVNQKFKQLFESGDERAKFLASVNPYWNEQAVKENIYLFNQYTLQEITTFLEGEYQKNFEIFDRLLNHADHIGDYFAQGLFNYINYSQQSQTGG